MKQVQITVPYEKTEAVFDFVVDALGINNVTKMNADNAHLLYFRIPDAQVNEAIEKLKSRGVGVEYGFIDILDLKATLPREAEEVSSIKIQRDATLAVEEIYENVKKQTKLSFDFIAFSILAAAMAGFGLMQNSIIVIVASMLLSPLMGPMLGVALGYVVRDRALFIRGTRNELISLGLSFAVGIVMAIMLPILVAVTPANFVSGVTDNLNSGVVTEITRRAGFSAIDVGVAIFSGAAVAVSVTKGDMSSLVGVAISAALMPPAVNAALMLMLGVIYGSTALAGIGIGSLLLLTMNIILIDLAAIVMFRIKKLTPLADRSATWTAVTQFTKTRSESLYHKTKPEPNGATFTPAPDPAPAPAPTTEGEPVETKEEAPKKEKVKKEEVEKES